MIKIPLAGGWVLGLDQASNEVVLIFTNDIEQRTTGVTLGTYSDENPPMDRFEEAIQLVRTGGLSDTPLN